MHCALRCTYGEANVDRRCLFNRAGIWRAASIQLRDHTQCKATSLEHEISHAQLHLFICLKLLPEAVELVSAELGPRISMRDSALGIGNLFTESALVFSEG